MMTTTPSLIMLVISMFLFLGEISQPNTSAHIMELHDVTLRQRTKISPTPAPSSSSPPSKLPSSSPPTSSTPPSLPEICQPPIIEPAVDCGCFRYSRLFLGLEEWKGYERLCLERLDGDLESGRIICRETDFVREGSGGVNVTALNNYFREARRECIFTRPVRPPSIRFRRETYVDRGATPFHLAEREFGLRARQHNILLRSCLVTAYVSGVSRAEARNMCCPRNLWR